MATRGRKPKPTALKLLHGDRADRISTTEPAAVAGLPECPDHIAEDPIAHAAWDRMVIRLDRLGVLSATDGEALALYCSTYSDWRTAEDEIKAKGQTTMTAHGGLKVSPYVTIANTAKATMQRLLVEFGCTPSSRSRVAAPAAPPKDELTEFLSKRKT